MEAGVCIVICCSAPGGWPPQGSHRVKHLPPFLLIGRGCSAALLLRAWRWAPDHSPAGRRNSA